jgi:hypothetical protein
MTKHHVKPKRAAPAKPKRVVSRDTTRAKPKTSVARTTEARSAAVAAPPAQPLAYSGKGFVTTELQRQLHYCLSERGEVLSLDTSNGTFGVTKALDGSTVLAPGQSLTTIKTRAAAIDPSIV